MSVAVPQDFQQYRAPQVDRSALVHPGGDQLLRLLERPYRFGDDVRLEFCGKSLDVVRRNARQEAVGLAIAHTSQYANVDASSVEGNTIEQRPVLLSGHQPELFHPGVWYKNYLLSSLAAARSGIAINFLVDNDLCRRTAIRVPTQINTSGSGRSSLGISNVAFDELLHDMPWELRSLSSWDTWNSFPQRVREALPAGCGEPLLDQLWPIATEAVRRHGLPGLAIAEARHRIELDSGVSTLEVPSSQLVSTRAFARFSIQLLSELPRFLQVYNEQLSRYRDYHKIRNHAHPVPALVEEDGWLESPWWVYRSQANTRQRLWVRLLDDQLMLCDRAGWQAVIEGRLDCDNAATQWLDLLSDGICLRPRALLTTMYLRLMVSDLFLHGIGGGKYDQLTDSIIREFFGIEPPPMCVASATLHLPLDRSSVGDLPNPWRSLADVQQSQQAAKQRLWELQHHAEQRLDPSNSVVAELMERKQILLDAIPPRGEKWEWHHQMTQVNQQLKELAMDLVEATKRELVELSTAEKQFKLLESREYSFCLFPREFLVDQLRRLASLS